MKIENLRIERDYDDEFFVEVEQPVNIKIGYAAERVLATEVVKYALDNTDMKFMTVSLREEDNVLIYRATFPEGATIEHVIVVMQDVINEAERHIRYLRAVLEIVDLNRKEQYEQ